MVGSETFSSFASDAALFPPSICFLNSPAWSTLNLKARPRLRGMPNPGPSSTRGPAAAPATPSPAGAPERVVHGGERDLEFLRQ